MSASGVGPFENDSAMDLIDELRGLDDGEVIEALREALAAAAEVAPEEYLDQDFSEPAVVAASVVLAKTNGRVDVLEQVDLAGVVPEIPAVLFPLAVSALLRVLQEDSETYALWIDAGCGVEWRAEVEFLLREATDVAKDEAG